MILLPLVNGEGFYIGSKQALAKTRKSGESRFFDTLKKKHPSGCFFQCVVFAVRLSLLAFINIKTDAACAERCTGQRNADVRHRLSFAICMMF